MLDEEVIVKGAKNGSERLLIVNVLLMLAVPALMLGGNTEIARGVFIAMGILAPLNVIIYKRTWIDADESTLPMYFLALSPYVVSLAIAATGTPLLVSDEFASGEIWKFGGLGSAFFASANASTMSAITSELATIAAVACGLSIFFITDSRYIIRRIFFFASSGAAALALLGFAYKGLEALPRFILPSLGENSFATFNDASQWSAFAILWMGAALVIGAYTSQRFRLATFLYSLKFFAMLSAFVLLLSVLFCGTPLERTLSLFLTSAGYAIIFIDTVPTKTNLERHWTSKYVQSKHRKLRLAIPSATYAAVSILTLASSVWVGLSSWNNPNERLIVDEDAPFCTLAERRAVYTDALALLQDEPPTGWGTSSFPSLFAFKQGADLRCAPYPSPYSDLLQKLIENGIVGLVLCALTPVVFFLRWLRKRDFSKSGALMFMTLAGVLGLGVFDYPFQSIAVLASFWIILMSAFRWDDSQVR